MSSTISLSSKDKGTSLGILGQDARTQVIKELDRQIAEFNTFEAIERLKPEFGIEKAYAICREVVKELEVVKRRMSDGSES